MNIDETGFARREYARRIILRQTSETVKEMAAVAGTDRAKVLCRIAAVFASTSDLILTFHTDLGKPALPDDEYVACFQTHIDALQLLPQLRNENEPIVRAVQSAVRILDEIGKTAAWTAEELAQIDSVESAS